MESAQVEALIWFLRNHRSEDSGIEAKRAANQLPASCVESLSAFANTPGGGTLLLGVDESAHFAATGVADPGKLQQDLAAMAREQLSPALQPTISEGGELRPSLGGLPTLALHEEMTKTDVGVALNINPKPQSTGFANSRKKGRSKPPQVSRAARTRSTDSPCEDVNPACSTSEDWSASERT